MTNRTAYRSFSPAQKQAFESLTETWERAHGENSSPLLDYNRDNKQAIVSLSNKSHFQHFWINVEGEVIGRSPLHSA